jgi:Ca-activated chloride channel family protein
VASQRTPLIAAAVIGLVAIVGVRFALSDHGDGDQSPGANGPEPRPGCTLITMAASSEKAALLASLAGDYAQSGRTVDGACYDIKVNSVASGGAEAALARGWDTGRDGDQPDVWSPAASTWVGLLHQDLASNDRPSLVTGTPDSIVSTPLVLAMPKPMAEALGWPNKPIGWGDVLSLARNPQGWAAKGHPEWGQFKLGKTNPNLSTSGLAATVGAFFAATGTSSDLTADDLRDPKVRSYVATVEQSVVHYGDTTLTYLANLQRADDAGLGLGYASAVAVEEKSVIDYNSGNPTGKLETQGQHAPPKVPLVAVYPKEGTLFSDSPYAVLDAPWSTPEKKAGAADFFEFLRTDQAQKRFTDAGFRTWDGKAGPAITNDPNLIADGVKITLEPPAPAVLDEVRNTWADLRKKARVLLLLDVSGSMEQPVEEAGTSRLELAKQGVIKALEQFGPRDDVGVWVFTTDMESPSGIYQELVPIGPIGQQRQRIVAAVRGLAPLNGTPLYASIKGALTQLEAGYDRDRINALVVLTDGQNEYPPDNDLDGLVGLLRDQSVESPLRVFAIAYSTGADLDTLKQISEASQAAAYDATNPATIDQVMTAVISNF